MKQIIEVSTSKEEIERLVPALHKGRTFYYEHLVRYFFASQYVKNKVVLDLGCGSGYGSLILAKNGLAKRVIGVDISKDALDYARKSNIYKGLEFRKDDIRNLKSVKTSTIDCVVNFEVIEHIKEQEELLSEIKRTLKPQGLLIISTPNKYISLGDNPFHEKELYPEEFRSLLNKYFKNVTLLYQQMGFKDVIKKLDGNTISVVEDFSVGSEKTYGFEIDEKNSQFIIAICSDSELPRAEAVSLDTLLTDGLDLTQGISSLSHQIEDAYKAYIELQRIYDSKTWKMLWLYKRTTHIPTNIIRKIVPIWVRKRIKSKFNTLFTPERATVISKFIQRDWKSWKNKREDESLDILIFGIISYD